MKRWLKTALAFSHDCAAAALAFFLGMLLRHGEGIALVPWQHLVGNSLLFTAISGAVFLLTGLYRGIWAYASVRDLAAILRAVSLAVLIYLPTAFLLTRLADVPRTTPIIVWLILIIFLSGTRLGFRLLREKRWAGLWQNAGDGQTPVLLYGAGDEADLFIRALASNPHAPYRVLGVIDETGKRVGRQLHGVKILGTLTDLPEVMQNCRDRGQTPARLILTRGAAGQGEALLEMAQKQGLQLSRLPQITALQQADEAETAIQERPVAIEDLLGRAETVLERDAIQRLITGRGVLVTGGGGTIGGELCRQIAALHPAELHLIDNGEFNLYAVETELREAFPNLTLRFWLGDVRDAQRLKTIFTTAKPELVFHAAALKHVPIAEENVAETILTNIHGTRLVTEAAQQAGALATILISTDKAVNPSSVMGATKRIAELWLQAMDQQAGGRFVAVRFGNVLGSTGSVIPRFRAQLAKGGPLTVTHPEMTRYFMTVREAVELVLQASAYALRGESVAAAELKRGEILVLDMGVPVKILDLARQLIRLAGKRPHEDVEIIFTGLRAGEKLHEELSHASENLRPSQVDGVNILRGVPQPLSQLSEQLAELVQQAANSADAAQLRDGIAQLVPEFRAVAGKP
jgi:FlaA1/EpsC-like NDP-sugar epimerase